MAKRILIIDGHPDLDAQRFCHALADAYSGGATAAGHSIRRINLSQENEVSFLRSRAEWETSEPSALVRKWQEDLTWAEHIIIIYPLWLGDVPALLKAFFEQTFRPGFAIAQGKRSLWPGLLTGKSARIVVTMGMPGLIYRWFFRAHSLKSLTRNILKFVGIGPIRQTLIGSVESGGDGRHKKLLEKMKLLGERGQ